MKPQTAYKTVKLTPGQETPVDITGTSLYVDGADGPFAVSWHASRRHTFSRRLHETRTDIYRRIQREPRHYG